MSRKKIPEDVALLIEWQKRLGLTDWAIVMETKCEPSEMDVPDSEGCTAWEESTKSAKIQIVDPDKTEGLVRPFDFEAILVHELLHIKTTLLDSHLDQSIITDRVLHQIIDDLARAFVSAKRSKTA